MIRQTLVQVSDCEWRLPPIGAMRVPGVLYANTGLLRDMEDRVFEQMAGVAALPGIVSASYAMPDAHSGYGFPIGGVAAFDPDKGGVVSAGGVGFDIACGVRTLLTGITGEEIRPRLKALADLLFQTVPCGLGRTGRITIKGRDMEAMLFGGAQWAVAKGFGEPADLDRCEEGGRMDGADPAQVSDRAKQRMEQELGTLGSGNHYLEVQEVTQVFDAASAKAFGLAQGDVVVSIHCGSRGLGHQIATDYLKPMIQEAAQHGIRLPDKELACAPIWSATGQAYLAAMQAGVNCALANRQVLTHLTRGAFATVLPKADLRLLYDVSHNTCKEEEHAVDGRTKRLFVHRKGATRSLGPGHAALPHPFRAIGQPVLVGGSMGTSSYILAGLTSSLEKSFGSANHGAGRILSRSQAVKRYQGKEVVHALQAQGIHIRAAGLKGLAEEAPGAYKDVASVVEAVQSAGLARPVAELRPLACIKG